ncbi:hypothetical protein Tco_0415415 [Tanacetum coccineum]
MAPLPPREKRHLFLRYHGLEYTDEDIADFKEKERLFDTRGPLVRELILEFLNTLRFGEVVLDFDAPGTIQFQLGGARRRLSWRQFILALGLHTEEEMKSLSFARDLVLRLCHRMLAHSTTGRKSEAYISGGQFVARLAEYFGLLTAKILGGLTVIAPELPIIDMERQPNAVAGVHAVAEDAPIVDEGGQVIRTHLRTTTTTSLDRDLPQRMARLEEDVHKIRGVLTEQREVINAMARDFSRFST